VKREEVRLPAPCKGVNIKQNRLTEESKKITATIKALATDTGITLVLKTAEEFRGTVHAGDGCSKTHEVVE
jgi:hypothetical protein